MPNPVTVVRTAVESFDEPRVELSKSLLFWCPGCDDVHRIVFWQADGQSGPVWEWDGNEDAPTVAPSILVRWTEGNMLPADHPDFAETGHACHSFLRAGRWEFLTDSTHALAGQTVDMVPLPDWLVAERG